MNTKFLVIAGVFLGAITLLIAGTGTPFAVIETSPVTTKYFWLKYTSTGGGADVDKAWADTTGFCDKFIDGCKAAGAFAVLTCLFIGAAVTVAIIRLFAENIDTGVGRWILLVLEILGAICGIIAWAAAFGLFSSAFCDKKLSDNANAKNGPAAPLLLVGWILILAGIILEFVMASPAAEPAKAPQETENKN